MNNFKVDDFESVAYYLISLYYKTGCKYYCYRGLINRLLTIYKLCGIKYNMNFLDDCFIIRGSYIGIDYNLSKVAPHRYIYFKCNCVQPDGKEIKEVFDETVEILDANMRISLFKDKVSPFSKELLEKIFRKFGNYSMKDLASMIEEIKDILPVKKHEDKYSIDNDKYTNFLNSLDNSMLYRDNEILNFIKTFKVSSIDKLYPEFINKFKTLNSDQQIELINYLCTISKDNENLENNKIKVKK